jgi:type IV pilus assembly protein PilY1
VIYDGADPDGAVVYFATNDGYLHAINPNTGIERWAFIPEEFLGDQVDLYEDEASSVKHYGIDGSLRIQMMADNDAVIDSSTEKVYLTFGMRRGGTTYYSLDVSDPANPQLLWRRGSGDLSGNGQSWANAVPARIDISDPQQSSDKLVLVIAGGYDETQDGYDNARDSNGNSIYIVDSEDGDVLWHGGKLGADKAFSQMDSSIPADIKVVDLDTDGYADRMYAADMGGQVWRFDIYNGMAPADLITGGVIAQLGAAPLPPLGTTTDDADNRRFFYSPDVALVVNDDYNFIHIGIGSGYRAHPLSMTNHDRFYALRDYDTFGKRTDLGYSLITPIVDGDLIDVTNDTSASVPQGEAGWKLELNTGGSWVGEKVLAEARTFNNQVFFTTFLPSTGGNMADPCSPAPATNRLYIMDLFNGSAVVNMDGDATENEEEDRYQEFPGTITSEVVFIFPSPDDPVNCVGDECSPPPVACVDLFCFPTNFNNDPVRTFWSQESIE